MDERTQAAIHRLRGSDDFQQVIALLRSKLTERTTDLVFLKDSHETARAQGSVIELRELLGDLAP